MGRYIANPLKSLDFISSYYLISYFEQNKREKGSPLVGIYTYIPVYSRVPI